MNYVVEDNFDFYSELNESAPQEKTAICMISHEPLTYNAITLSCKHSFNYIPLYNELCIHNNKLFIICPYCRCKIDKLIPYIPLPTIGKIHGVNYPLKMCMPAPKCLFIIKSGLSCAHNGIEDATGIFCSKHLKHNLENKWTLEKEQMFKSKNVAELKEMLKSKGLKVGGLKKELVNRWFAKE